MRLTGDQIVRAAALAAVVVVAIVVALLLLRSPGGGYKVKARFQNAAQLVKGNLVQTGGAPIGTVETIDLTPDGQAEVTMKLEDDYAPLRRGTLATIRQASLSGVANRYIDLRMAPQSGEKIPEGGVIEQDATTTAVDLDQLFNTFDPATRKALSGVITGSAEQVKGKGKQFNEGIAYLNPSLAASSRLFRELNRDTPLLERFIVSSSQLVTDIADRRDDLAGLVDELATTTTAIGNQKEALAESIGRLPGFQRRANTTFVNLRAALDDLDPLVDASKPVAKKLRPFLAELRPLARDARPTLNDLSQIVKRPGAANDLIELTSLQEPLRDVTTRTFDANGKQRDGAFKASQDALKGNTPEFAFFRPYTPDLLGWFDDFSHSGTYDALGAASRVGIHANPFALTGAGGAGQYEPIPPQLRDEALNATLETRQNNRCPGAGDHRTDDGSGPYKPTPDFPCDASQVLRAADVRRALAVTLVLAAAAAYVLTAGGAKEEQGSAFAVEFDNAFGLVKGGDVKVAGVRAGKISKLRVDRKSLRALVDFKLTKQGFGDLRADTHCESRPQSLIGEYFIDCTPGTSPDKLEPGATIPVERTASTIPADLLANIMRRPYRERLRIILNELGAGVGGRAEDVNATVRRASPALRETDKVLKILARQNQVLKDLTTNADTVVGDLAGNHRNVGRFVKEAEDAATTSAARRRELAEGLARLPAFLRELRPTMAELGATADASTPYLRDLSASAGQLERLLENLGPFSESSRVNVRTLADATDVGRPAVRAAKPTVAELTKTTAKAPELANNLEIVLRDLDDRGRAVEADKRSPGGKGYTGFESILTYIFDQMMAINIYDENGHILKINLSASECSAYQNADSLRRKEKDSPGFLKRCIAALGPNQPGVTTADPTDTGVDDPGHEPQAPSSRTHSKKGRRRAARKQKKSENTPGQPDLKKALERLLGSGGGTNRPAPALPKVPPVTLPSLPKVPALPNLDPGGSRGQSVDPKPLLDYLLSP